MDDAYPDFYIDEETSGDDSPDFDYKPEKVSEKNYYKIELKSKWKNYLVSRSSAFENEGLRYYIFSYSYLFHFSYIMDGFYFVLLFWA